MTHTTTLEMAPGTFLRERSVFILIFAILTLNLLLKKILGVNETVVLAEAKHFCDPSWIPNDWFLNQHIGYRLVFNAMFGSLARVLPLHMVSVAGRLLIYALFAAVMEKTFRTLRIHVALVVPAVALFLAFQSLVAREWMLGGLETKSFAYACALGALYAFSAGRYRTMFLLSGLSASFHILVGVYSAFCLGTAMLFNFDRCRKDIKKILYAVPLAFLASIPAITAILQYLFDSAQVDSHASGLIYVIERLPHHTFPGAWTKPWAIRFSASCLLFAAALGFSRTPARRLYAAYGLGSALLFCAGLALYHTGNYPWLKLYWFRHPDVFIPLLGILLLASFLSDILDDTSCARSGPDASSFTVRLRKPALILAVTLTAAGAATSIHAFANYANRIISSESPFYLSHLDPPLRQALAWIKVSTPADSSVLASPVIDEFYIAAERAMLVSFKHSAQIDSDNIEWYHRIVLTNGGTPPIKKGFHMQDELDRSFYSLSADQIGKIARLYKMNYYLGTNRTDLPYGKVYSNAGYAVYDLGNR